MQMLNHPHIVRLYEFTEDRSKFYIAMEVVTGGELFDRIAQKLQYSEEDAREVRDSSSDDNTKHSTQYSDEDARGVRYRHPRLQHTTQHTALGGERARDIMITQHTVLGGRRQYIMITTLHNTTQHAVLGGRARSADKA